jgi:diguanylate cyclase (GGDEF)-like protein
MLFNASQYVLALAAAACVLLIASPHAPVRLSGANIAAVLGAGVVLFVANHLLACTGGALLADLPIVRYLRDDLVFQAWTAGSLIAFAPAVVTAADQSVALVPVLFLPMLAIYIGGRQAASNGHRAYHDQLTELPNRAFFTEHLGPAISLADREHRELAVMILDLDDFKAVNDTLGHAFGDLVLKRIAARLSHEVDGQAILARLGGDEFAVAFAGDRESAETCAQKLLAALESPVEIDGLALQVGGSVGIACYPMHGADAQELVRHADVALYCAKELDRGYEVYAEEQDDYSIDRLALAANLRRGIERGELIVFYQPKVPLNGEPTRAVEALVRWNHPQLGRIGPDGFVPLAEQSGLITLLTEAVLDASLRQISAWQEQGLQIRVSVNISTRSLIDHELPRMIRSLLERYGVSASLLQLEITESRVVTDVGRARVVLDELRAMGVTIAIDDFGTGFSSLSQLQHLPIDEIKIDRSFVTRIESDRSHAMLVRSIIELGRNLGVRVTAEGVESEEVEQRIRSLGCDFAQGFWFGAPTAGEECERRYFGERRQSAALTLAGVTEIESAKARRS